MTTPAPVLPWVAPAVRTALLADVEFSALVGGRVSTRLGNITAPCATVAATANPRDVSAGVWSPLVVVNGWCPQDVAGDPEGIAWSIAATGAAVLARVRNQAYLNIHFSCRVAAGPDTDVDTSRGDNNVLFRAFVLVELTVHAR